MLTYCFFVHGVGMRNNLFVPFNVIDVSYAPRYVKLIADWDVWAFIYGEDTRNFHTGFELYDFHPQSDNWRRFYDQFNHEEEIMKNGKIATKFRDGFAEKYCRERGFEMLFHGYKTFAINLGLCNSDYFASIAHGNYDLYLAYSFNGRIWSVSIYAHNPDIDVSEIAKKYGGGGHKGAAGFTVADISAIIPTKGV